ncbi:hypothetical protein Hanom_Chr12g01167891 [Helianthus anomalus]
MAEPSNPLSIPVENPEPSSSVAAEEETLLRDIQMPPEYGATYPQEGDTAGDTPAGYATMFADFFRDCNLRLPLTVFVAEFLEYYKLHISQLSPLGMIQVRNFEYTFRALGIEPIVGDFLQFYQLYVSMGFFSFRQRDHTPKLMIPSKGMMKWKTKFFYVKAAAITRKLQFRNVTGTIITENISVPKADMVDWFPRLRIIGWVKLDNRQLWVLRMMLGRLSRNVRPVLQEKSGEEAPLWRMLFPNFKGEVETMACADGEEGFNRTIIGNFWMPDRAALNAVLPQGKDLGALGNLAATGVPKQPVLKLSDKHQRKTKKLHEAVVVPSLVPEVAGGATGGSTMGAEPVDVKKGKGDADVAGGQKAPKLRKTRYGPEAKTFVDVEVQKKGEDSPSIEVVSGGGTPPFLHADETLKKTAGETIVDTLDSSNNLFDPQENDGNQGEKPKSPEKTSGSTAAGKGGEDQPSIQPGEIELEFYYRSYAPEHGLDYHRPPWNVKQEDDVSNDPSAGGVFFFGGGGGRV